MYRKAVSMLALVTLISLFSFTVNLEPAQAQALVYINLDGAVTGTNSLQRQGNVYTLTGSISGGIQILKSNIVVEGAGYTLQGKRDTFTEKGLEIVESNNVTIRNLNIRGFTRGIRFTNSSDCRIYQNVLANNSIGIEMGYVDGSYSNNNTVKGNVVVDCVDGIRLISGSSNTISENIITANNASGISVWGASENDITWNNITDNNRGIYFETSGINVIHHNNLVNNTNAWWDYGLTPWPFQLPFSVNIWDDGKEGNYWSDYEDRYPDAKELEGLGVWDTPYVIDENNQDNYPLIDPVVIPENPGNEELTKTNEEPFPTSLVIASTGLMAVVVAGLLVYFRKRKRGIKLE